MSADNEVPAHTHEVVIVRRRGGMEEEGHHGGAWKIAFADLMTAMMTFFLVMWLLSVSDKEKVTRIASYFNPTKLADRLPTNKGVNEVKGEEQPRGTDPEGKIERDEEFKTPPSTDKDKPSKEGTEKVGDPQKAEEELFNDPYGVLARLALRAIDRGEKSNGGKLEGAEALPGGEAYRNPFEPYAADQRPEEPESVTADNPAGSRPPPPPPAAQTEPAPRPEPAPKAAVPAPEPKVAKSEEAEPGPKAEASQDTQPEPAKIDQAVAQALEKEIKTSLAMLGPAQQPDISVEQTDEGLLVSLTDDFRFGMFNISSAVPKPELVVVMEKVAKALAARNGHVIVRGHTDGRPFKSARNDNWRLSTARAQTAYYMLVRGGMDQARVDRIEGHADRDLRVPSDPNAAQNRRIEILLKASKT